MQSATSTAFIVLGALIVGAVASYVFVETVPAPQVHDDSNATAKIDINAVCEGTLAYMTFESGAAAEAWVQECKEGKHPEAIEQWKAQMGIASDVAI